VKTARTVFLALVVLAAVFLGFFRPHPAFPPDFRRFDSPLAGLQRFTPPAAEMPAPATIRKPASPPGAQRVSVLRGIVLDPDDHPVAGVEIRRRSAADLETLRNLPANAIVVSGAFSQGAPPGWRTVTGADGRFQLPRKPEEREVLLYPPEKEGFVSAARRPVLAAGEEDAVLRMRPLRTFDLNVEARDATNGEPLPRFEVQVVDRSAAPPPEKVRIWRQTSFSGKDGLARLEGLPFVPGSDVQVTVSAPGILRGNGGAGDLDARLKVLRPRPGDSLNLLFRLTLDAPERVPGAVVISGRVVAAPSEAPVAGAEVWIGDPFERVDAHRTKTTRRVMTRGDGSFRIARPSESTPARIGVIHPDFDPEVVDFRPGEEVVVRLHPRGSLRVTVTDRGGNPVPEVPLLLKWNVRSGSSVARNDWKQKTGTTDIAGGAGWKGLASGTYHLFVLPAPGAADEQALAHESVSLSPGESKKITIAMDPPDRILLSGHVLRDGIPDPALLPFLVPYAEGRGWVQARPDGFGGYRAGGMERGEYLVLLLPEDDRPGEGSYGLIPSVSLEGFGEKILDFTLPPGEVRGRLDGRRDGDGIAALPRAPFRTENGPARELCETTRFRRIFGVSVEPSGRFLLPHLGPGDYRLELYRDGRKAAEKDFLLAGSLDLGDWPIPEDR